MLGFWMRAYHPLFLLSNPGSDRLAIDVSSQVGDFLGKASQALCQRTQGIEQICLGSVPGLAYPIELSTEGLSKLLRDGFELSGELLSCVQQAVPDVRFGEHVLQALS